MKRALILVMALTALIISAGDVHASVSRASDIEARLPVQGSAVYCPATQADWDADPYGGGYVAAYTWMEGPNAGDIHLSYRTCTYLRGTARGENWADAVETLYHEWVHSVLHDQNEGDTECVAFSFYRYALRHFWSLSPTQAQAAYDKAWRLHELLGIQYPTYKGSCTKNTPDPVP